MGTVSGCVLYLQLFYLVVVDFDYQYLIPCPAVELLISLPGFKKVHSLFGGTIV